ncbi:hypothetical protein [Streptomyces sp. SAS_270]
MQHSKDANSNLAASSKTRTTNTAPKLKITDANPPTPVKTVNSNE